MTLNGSIWSQHELMRWKKQLAKVDLLILDELDYVPSSKLDSELLFGICGSDPSFGCEFAPRTLDRAFIGMI